MIPKNFEMKFDKDRIEIRYKNIEIFGIDSPEHWHAREKKHKGWILHRWVHYSNLYSILDAVIIKNTTGGYGIKIVGVDEI